MSFNSKDFKGFTFRSGPVKSTTKQNSSFWWNDKDDIDVDDFLGLDTDVKKGKDLVALAGYKRAISNFVNIVTGDSIPVVFNSKDESYTDGKKVVIGSNLDDKKSHFMKDSDLKQGWLNDSDIVDKDDVFAVFDDRNQVVDMWRDNGLMVFQVADGDF